MNLQYIYIRYEILRWNLFVRESAEIENHSFWRGRLGTDEWKKVVVPWWEKIGTEALPILSLSSLLGPQCPLGCCTNGLGRLAMAPLPGIVQQVFDPGRQAAEAFLPHASRGFQGIVEDRERVLGLALRDIGILRKKHTVLAKVVDGLYGVEEDVVMLLNRR